jgi:hypothetical protein
MVRVKRSTRVGPLPLRETAVGESDWSAYERRFAGFRSSRIVKKRLDAPEAIAPNPADWNAR